MILAVSPPNHGGQFITIEGLDGCGKSTQLARLAAELRSHHLELVMTREPGGTASGERIREILLDSATSRLSSWAELALMFAARAQHLDEVILPALHAGKFVLCDRFTDSSEAYQGGGRQLGSEPIWELHRILCRGLQPDLTILMDADPSASIERARRRNLERKDPASGGANESNENRFEQESRAFFQRVSEKYLEIARREPQRVVVVNARPPADDVFPVILAEVRRKLNLNW
jgi:dTMP kinase